MKHIHILGDSIVYFYFPYIEPMLRDTYLVTRKGMGLSATDDLDHDSAVNGGDSGHVRAYLERYGDKLEMDVLLLNCGLHDIKHDITQPDGVLQQPLSAYRENLTAVLDWADARKIPVFWSTTTPVDESVHNVKGMVFHRFAKDLEAYNAAALDVMRARGVPVIDLCGFTRGLGGREIFADHVHYTDPIRRLQAAFVAGQIRAFDEAGLFDRK